MTSCSRDGLPEPAAHRSVREGEVDLRDRPTLVHYLQLGAADMQDRRDVLVHEVWSEDDPLVHDVEQPVRADESNQLDPAAPRQPRRGRGPRRREPGVIPWSTP